MNTKSQIDSDIKQSMLSGDKKLTMALKNLKSAIQYAEVENGQELNEEQITVLLVKEQKKRRESAQLYEQGNNHEKQQAELFEVEVISKYLPTMLDENEISKIVDEVIKSIGEIDQSKMGQIIGQVKAKTGANADGSIIAKIVRERLQ